MAENEKTADKPPEKKEYEENVITSEEFEKLEKKEGNKKFFDDMKKGEEKSKPKKEEKVSGDASIGSLTLKIEKLEGKLETVDDMRRANDERFSRVSEEIGELRSSILERDRAFDRVEKGFQTVNEIIEELEPRRLRKELDKKTEEIIKNQARIESLGTQLKESAKGVKELRDLLSKIKDVKNIVNLSNDMGAILTKVEKERRTINKTAGKIEAIFSELSKKISEFDSYKDKVDFNAETMHDLMKSLDMLELKLENVLKKEDMSKVDEKIKKLETEVKDQVHDIKDVVDILVSSLKKTDLKEILDKQGVETVSDVNERISNILMRLGAIEELGRGMEILGKDVNDLKTGVSFIRNKMGTVQREIEKRPGEGAMAQRDTGREEDARKVLSDMINYVRSTLKLGYATKQIKKELLDKGWPRKTVNEIILREAIRRRKEMINKTEHELDNEEKKRKEYEPKKNIKKMMTNLSPQY